MHKIGIDIRKLNDFGIGSYIRTVLRAAVGARDELAVLALYNSDHDIKGLPEEIEYQTEGAGLYTLSEPFQIGLSVRKAKLDVFHAPHYVTPYFSGTPLVTTIHDLIHLRFPHYLSGFSARLYARHFLKRAVMKSSVVFTVSEFSKTDILKQYDVDPEKILVTHNVIDESEFSQSQDELDRQFDTLEEMPERYVLYSGNIKPHKNVETLLRAFKGFRNRVGREWQLCFAGATFADSREGGKLLRMVEELEISDAVRFLGYLDRNVLVAVLRRASLFCFPSKYEGFGLPPLEAMCAGVPVVSSTAASLPEILGDAALYAEPEDDIMFADSMARIVEHPDLRNTLIERGRKNVKRFAFDSFAATLLAGYRKALK